MLFLSSEICYKQFNPKVSFPGTKPLSFASFKIIWNLKKGSGVTFESFEKRKVVEDKLFWQQVSSLMKKDDTFENLRVEMRAISNAEKDFEREVMSKLHEKVKIIYVNVTEDDAFLKDWVTQYTISAILTTSTDFLSMVKYSRALKAITLIQISNLEMLVPLFQGKNEVHALRIESISKLPNHDLLDHWHKNILNNNLYPGEICIRGPSFYSETLKAVTRSRKWNEWTAKFDELNKRKEKKIWSLNWKVNELIKEIEKNDVADEEKYYCYLTMEQAAKRILVNEDVLKEVIKHGTEKMKIIKVFRRRNEDRICSILKRKLPREFL